MTSPWGVAALGGAGLALVSSLHCLTMCGPLAAASQARGGSGTSGRYVLGRFTSYATLGLLAGSVGQVALATRWARWAEAGLAWGLAGVLLASGLRYLGVARPAALLRIGRGPRRSWVGRVLARVADEPVLLGAATALLPCAALYGALIASAALGTGARGAVFMLSFALVTTPVILGGAQLARLASLGGLGRRALGAVLLAAALVTALRPISALQADDHPPSCPMHHGGSQ